MNNHSDYFYTSNIKLFFPPISPMSIWGLVQIVLSDLVLFSSVSLLMWAAATLLQRKNCRFWQEWVTLEQGVKDSLVRTWIRLLQHWMVGTAMIDLVSVLINLDSYCLPSLLSSPAGLKWWEVSFIQFKKKNEIMILRHSLCLCLAV